MALGALVGKEFIISHWSILICHLRKESIFCSFGNHMCRRGAPAQAWMPHQNGSEILRAGGADGAIARGERRGAAAQPRVKEKNQIKPWKGGRLHSHYFQIGFSNA
jgi:hypothetical protein